MLMMADAGGDVHPLLPLDTLERYRVDAGRLRNATLVRPRLRVGLTRKAYTRRLHAGLQARLTRRARSC